MTSVLRRIVVASVLIVSTLAILAHPLLNSLYYFMRPFLLMHLPHTDKVQAFARRRFGRGGTVEHLGRRHVNLDAIFRGGRCQYLEVR
jgi:hypothetical protein